MKDFEEVNNNFYWHQFYSKKKEHIKTEPTDFAVFAYKYIKDNFKKHSNKLKMIDIGCGNGRDTFFFREKNIDAIGVDANFSYESEYITKEEILILNLLYKELKQETGYKLTLIFIFMKILKKII